MLEHAWTILNKFNSSPWPCLCCTSNLKLMQELGHIFVGNLLLRRKEFGNWFERAPLYPVQLPSLDPVPITLTHSDDSWAECHVCQATAWAKIPWVGRLGFVSAFGIVWRLGCPCSHWCISSYPAWQFPSFIFTPMQRYTWRPKQQRSHQPCCVQRFVRRHWALGRWENLWPRDSASGACKKYLGLRQFMVKKAWDYPHKLGHNPYDFGFILV